MTPARNANAAALPRIDFDLPVLLPREGTVHAGVTLRSTDGRRISGGTAEIWPELDGGWSAVVRSLDRPGAVAAMYFSEGVRQVTLELADGRRGIAAVLGTSFLANSERVCRLAATDPLR